MTTDAILVTGSSGCLGYPLANRLAQEGHDVVGLDIVAPRGPATFRPVVGDVCDPQLVHRLFLARGFRGVVHCGGISGQMVAPDDPYRNCHVNIGGTIHLLEAARVHGVARFVYCSSQSAYGEAIGPIVTEQAPFRPSNVYGATKAACDALVRAYAAQHGLNATSLRIGRVYGPGRRTESVIFAMLSAAVAGRALTLPASGGRQIQYVYDADIVTALYRAFSAPRLPQAAYNVSGPGAHTVEEIAGMIRAMIPNAALAFDATRAPTGSNLGATVDYSAAARDFGYAPAFEMAKGLAAYHAWFRAGCPA